MSALAFRTGSFVSAGNASGGNLTLTKPTGTADGDRVTINVYFEPDTCNISISPGVWESVEKANTGAFKTKCFTKIASSEPASYTISNDVAGNQWRSATGVAYQNGTGSGTLIDVSSTNQGDATPEVSQTAPSVTPTGTDRMICWIYGNFDGSNPTGVTGYCTNLRGSLGSAAIADALNSTGAATGTTRPNGGVASTDFACMHVAIISDIAGGAATSLPLPPPRIPPALLSM